MPATPAMFRALLRAALPSLADFARLTQAATVLDFGPVRLPALPGLYLNDGLAPQDDLTPAARADGPCLAVCAFGLSLLSEHELSHRLATLSTASDYTMFLDIKAAERNLELPASLLLNGMRRLCGRTDSAFQRLHGLEGLLWREAERFQPVERRTLLGGGLSCVLVKCLRHER
ncbi:hypothetical protein [Mailhella sp.]|uniref:hypothetical protein n=1 Tax=Mailhella sp. TaxID=1981029 RepID=UPI00406420C1